jgi:hypothetical protein
MNADERTQRIISDPIDEKYPIGKTAIADNREYKITLADLDRFERELAKVDREDPNLHPRLILGRINKLSENDRSSQTRTCRVRATQQQKYILISGSMFLDNFNSIATILDTLYLLTKLFQR